MSEADQATGRANAHSSIDACCESFRKGLHELCDAFTPPVSAANHFREARLEFLRGIRDIIDHRIDTVSRSQNKGARVPVD
jgi:hypothetical protein